MHRVVAPREVPLEKNDGDEDADGTQMLPERYSIPFFVHPDPETVIEPMTLEEGEEKKYEAVVARQWREYNTRKDYGFEEEKTGSGRMEQGGEGS